jgi:ATP-dependent DNA ligase
VTISTYKTKIASRYIPVKPDQIGLKIMESTSYHTSVKYDGFFAVLSLKEGKAILQNGNEKSLEIKAILEAAVQIKEDVVLVGELCLFKDGKSQTHRELSAALDEPEKHDIRFGVYDLLLSDEKTLDNKQKFDKIKSLANGELIFSIPQNYFESRADIINLYKQIEGKEEGLVVRSSDDIVYKIKPETTLDMVVLGYALNAGTEESLRELLLGIVDANNDYQIVAKCGNGFSESDRVGLINKLKPMMVQSAYTEVSGAKTAFVMVEPVLVAELTCLDMITETSKGAIRKSILTYDKSKGYALKGQSCTISCISPVFRRLRDDKKADHSATGGQEFIDLLEVKPASEQEITKASEVIVREVYTKKGKAGTAVRKFLGVETHKADTGMYAPFFVMYSDFSSGRKTPLEQEIVLCDSKQEMEEKLSALIAENVKSGWEKV